MSQKNKRTIVGYPLSPNLLRELNVIDQFPPTPADFNPQKNWTNTYRIWTCHGYRESGNADRGFLKIEKINNTSDKTFEIKIKKNIINDKKIVNSISANILCLNDKFASPVSWNLSSKFYTPDGKIVSDIGTEENVKVVSDQLEVSKHGRIFKRNVPKQFTSNWCLFEAVQRFRQKAGFILNFDMLEGLSLLRRKHKLEFCDEYLFKLNGETKTLYHYNQLGMGSLPYEYWLDEKQRLQMVVTLSVAYILDDDAENKIG